MGMSGLMPPFSSIEPKILLLPLPAMDRRGADDEE
jgi:hypothetical protein